MLKKQFIINLRFNHLVDICNEFEFFDMKQVNKNDINVRLALLTVYKLRDFYTNEPLDPGDFDVDHLIPENISEEELSMYIEKLKLPSDFNKNCLINLVPVRRSTNSRKSDLKFNLHNLRYYFGITLTELPKLEEEIDKNRKKLKFEKLLSNLPIYKDKDDLLEKIDNAIFPEQSTFPIENNDLPGGIVVRSKQFVRLGGRFPDDFGSPASCIILFKSLKIRDCQITFSEPYISGTLLSGLKTRIEEGKRSFVLFPDAKNNYFIQLGNNRLSLTYTELSELCEILDSYGESFLKWKDELCKKYEVLDLEESGIEPGAFRLFKVKRQLWYEMIAFARRFKYKEGKTSWHMFDADRGSIRVTSRDEDSRFISNFHAWIRAEQVETMWEANLVYPDEDVWIVWYPSHLVATDKYCFESRWSAKITKNFLVTEMIPYVIYELEHRNKRNKLFKKSFTKFRESFQVEHYVY